MGMLIRRHRKGDSNAETQKGNQQGHATETESQVEGQETKEQSSLKEKTVNELRDIAKEHEVEGYSTMKKSELIEALEG